VKKLKVRLFIDDLFRVLGIFSNICMVGEGVAIKMELYILRDTFWVQVKNFTLQPCPFIFHLLPISIAGGIM
jgi:hypothetical protein